MWRCCKGSRAYEEALGLKHRCGNINSFCLKVKFKFSGARENLEAIIHALLYFYTVARSFLTVTKRGLSPGDHLKTLRVLSRLLNQDF